MFALRGGTANQTLPLGPFLDETDGITPLTALTIANTDIKLLKFGTTVEANKNSGGAIHLANGRYYCVIDATDTDTIGPMRVSVHVAGALPVWIDCCVYNTAIFDGMFGFNGCVPAKLADNQSHGGAAAVLTLQHLDVSNNDGTPAVSFNNDGVGPALSVTAATGGTAAVFSGTIGGILVESSSTYVMKLAGNGDYPTLWMVGTGTEPTMQVTNSGTGPAADFVNSTLSGDTYAFKIRNTSKTNTGGALLVQSTGANAAGVEIIGGTTAPGLYCSGAPGIHAFALGSGDGMKLTTATGTALNSQVTGVGDHISAGITTELQAGLATAAVLDQVQDQVEADQVIVTSTTPWTIEYRQRGTATVLLTKNLKKLDGTNLTSSDVAVGQQVQ